MTATASGTSCILNYPVGGLHGNGTTDF
jgi:hypothetical protein